MLGNIDRLVSHFVTPGVKVAHNQGFRKTHITQH